MPFDVARDFVPIGFVGESPMIIGASPSLGVDSLPELISLTKRRPGEINLAVLTRGGLPHLTGEWLRSASGADLTLIHYPGAPQALTDVMGGRVHLAIESLRHSAARFPADRSKRLRSPQRNACPICPTCRLWPRPFRASSPSVGWR